MMKQQMCHIRNPKFIYICVSLFTGRHHMRLHPEMAYPGDKMLFMTPHVEKRVSTEMHTSVFQAWISHFYKLEQKKDAVFELFSTAYISENLLINFDS